MKLEREPLHKIFWFAAFILILGLSYLWRFESDLWSAKTLTNSYGYDEGIHLILAKLWATGYTPYEQIFVSYPPVFMWSMGIPWKLFQRAEAIQFLMTTYALLGVVAVIYLGTVYNSPLAGLIAGALLSFTPAYFEPSIRAMGEVPSVGIAVLAVALAEQYRRSEKWIWMLLAGTALAFSLSLKVLPIFAVPLVGLMLMSRHIDVSQSWTTWPAQLLNNQTFQQHATILVSSFIVVFLAPALFFDTTALYQQVVEMRLVSRNVTANPYELNTQDIVSFMFGNAGLMALSIYGFVFVVTPRLQQYWLLLLWLALVWVSMYMHMPLRPKHLPIFLPIMSLLAGFAIAHAVDVVKHRSELLSLRGIAVCVSIIIAISMVVWNTPAIIAQNYGNDSQPKEIEERLNAIHFINRVATPTDCVIADNPVFLFGTGRLPPPQLAETSQTRIDTGYLTLSQIQQTILTSRCHVVAVVTPRFEEIPGLTAWLTDNFLGLYRQSDETLVFFAQKGADNNYQPLQYGNFDQIVRLYGQQLSFHWQERQGAISLYWQLESPIQKKYYQKFTLYDASGNLVYQTKRLPFEGQFDPATWQVKEKVRDTFWLEVPSDLPAQIFDIYLSLCQTENDQCLTLTHQTAQSALHLGQIQLIE